MIQSYFVSPNDDGGWKDTIFTLDDVLEMKNDFEDVGIMFEYSEEKHPNGNPLYLRMTDSYDNTVYLLLTDDREQNTLEVYGLMNNDPQLIFFHFMRIMKKTGKVDHLVDSDFYSHHFFPETVDEIA